MSGKYGKRIHHSAGRGPRRFQRHAEQLPPLDQLRRWFAREGLVEFDQETWEKLGLKQFLQRTGHIALPPEERVRQLAILAESTAAITTQPRGWALLERMYDYAARWDSRNPWIEHSRAISAMACLNGDISKGTRETLLQAARRALQRALAILPDDGLLLSTMGQVEYAANHTEEALGWYDRALAVEPDRPWASLYRAHCLHDLKRWADAAAAYSAVPQDAFTGPAAWRMALLVEQRGWCHLKAGNTDAAKLDFEQVLQRYLADLPLAETALSRILIRVAKRHFPELRPQAFVLAQQLGWQWAIDVLEP